MPHLREECKNYTDRNGKKHSSSSGDYSNENATELVIRYITRTRPNEKCQQDLISYGGFGVRNLSSIESIISDFKYVQLIHDSTGRQIYHFVLSFSLFENGILNKDYRLIHAIAYDAARWFFLQGFQVIFAVHDEIERLSHIHFALNAINHLTHRKMHLDLEYRNELNIVMNEIALSVYRTYFNQRV